jgi:hypothetical protein
MLFSGCHRTFFSIPRLLLLLCVTSNAASIATAQSGGTGGLSPVCPLVKYERQRDLDDSETELELVKNEDLARNKVFNMIEKLWAVRSIEREVYLDHKRLRDRTRVRIARLNTQISQLKIVVEQYVLTCDQVRGNPAEHLPERVNELQSEYRRLDCELLAKDSEIADIDYEFDQQILEATRTLVEGNIKSKHELVIDEYDLSQSRARSESYRRRTTICKEKLAG